jgi:hypothetical protein
MTDNKQALLTDVKETTKKPSRHVTIALNHLNKRRESLLEKRAGLTKEIEELDAAILALG